MKKIYSIQNKRLVEELAGAGCLLVYINPTDAEKKELVSDLQVDEHTLTSALDPDEPARAEIEPSHVALIFKRPKNYSGDEKFLFKVSSIGLFLYKDKLVLVLPEARRRVGTAGAAAQVGAAAVVTERAALWADTP